jgi:lysophospholipase L1-like esterase
MKPTAKLPSRMRRHRYLRPILATGAVLVLAAVAFNHYWLDLRVGSGPAGAAVRREAFATVWSRRPVHLVGLGDSVTAGYGASAGHAYFDRLAHNPDDELVDLRGLCLASVLPNLTARNLALSGSSSFSIARRLERLEVAGPDVFGLIVVTTGGNDLIHDYGRSAPREDAMYGATLDQARPWIDGFAARLEAMVAGLESRFPGGCAIFLANIYDPTDETGSARLVGLPTWPDGLAMLAEYNRVIAACAAAHDDVHLVDIRTPFLGHGLYCRQFWRRHYRRVDPHFWYLDIIEDPNERGYDAIRREFLNAMAAVLPIRLSEQAGMGR